MTASVKLLRNLQDNLPPLLLIEDSLECRGHCLLNSFVRKQIENGWNCTYIQYDCPTSLQAQAIAQLGISPIPVYSDAVGWSQSSDLKKYFDVSNIHFTAAGKSLIVLDSLSSVLLHQSSNEICIMLKKLERRIKDCNSQIAVIALIHSDVHDDSTLSNLRYVSSSVLRLANSSFIGKTLCKGFFKKPGGKVVEKEELFELDSKFTLVRVEDAGIQSTENKQEQPVNKAVPSTTFRLGLTASEEKARSEVILPFASKRNAGGSGQIVYETEEADWDEEDPDDDLDL